MRLHSYIAIILLISNMAASCDLDDIDNQNIDTIDPGTKVALKLNKGLFDAINSNRIQGVQSGDSFVINEVEKEGSLIKIDLSYAGGCKQHEFDIIWDGSIYTDEPCHVNIIIIHSGNNDNCEAYITETITIDLKVLMGDNLYIDKCGYHIFSSFNASESSDFFVPVSE